MNLIQMIKEVNEASRAKRDYTREFQKEQSINKEIWVRSGIVPQGQIQTRGIISVIDNKVGEAANPNHIVGNYVARPMAQQRPNNLVEDLGIKYLTGLNANFTYPLIDGNNSEWLNEYEEGSVNDASFSSKHLAPRRLFSYVEYDAEILVASSEDVAGAIEEDLTNSVLEKVQDTMFNDIYDATNATTISDFDDIVAFELAASNKKISNGVYLVSPTAASKLKKVLNGAMPAYFNGMINGYRVIETPFLDGEKVIFGDWSKLMLGQWGEGLDITLNNVTKYPTIALIINSYWDWGIVDSNAFVFGTTATD